jgi:hypothetical protein
MFHVCCCFVVCRKLVILGCFFRILLCMVCFFLVLCGCGGFCFCVFLLVFLVVFGCWFVWVLLFVVCCVVLFHECSWLHVGLVGCGSEGMLGFRFFAPLSKFCFFLFSCVWIAIHYLLYGIAYRGCFAGSVNISKLLIDCVACHKLNNWSECRMSGFMCEILTIPPL